MPHSATGSLLYFGIFVLVYIGIWLSQYSSMKKRIKEMTAKIQN